MAVQPGTYNFTLQRRADYSLDLQFKDSSNAAIDLTGYTVYAQAWNEGRTTKSADFTVTYTNRSKKFRTTHNECSPPRSSSSKAPDV